MEQILRELSAQNEKARSNGGLRRGLREATPALAAAPLPAPAPLPATELPASEPPASAPATERPSTVQVERDGAFRTDEGTVSVRAYLPVKTLAPAPSAPIEIATVKVSDPRRIPTIRLPRSRGPKIIDATAPASPADENVPTLRSGTGAGAAAPSEETALASQPRLARWRLTAVAILALAAAIVATVAVRAWW